MDTQVEVYRKALEEIKCHCQTYWENEREKDRADEDFKHYASCQYPVARKALLTSKPEPVASVRKWEAEEEK